MEISWNFVSLKKWEPCSRVCLFIHRGGSAIWQLPMMHWTSLYIVPSPPDNGPHCTEPPTPRHGTSRVQGPPASDMVAETGDLFKLVHFRAPSQSVNVLDYQSKTLMCLLCLCICFYKCVEYVYLSADRMGGSGWRKIVDFQWGIHITK